MTHRLEGASEWLRCKALRMRAQGVYWSTWPRPNPIATQQIGYYDTPPWRCVRMAKMQGAEDEDAGSVLKYMTKPESDSNEADWLLWHTATRFFGKASEIQTPKTSSLPHPSWKPARTVLVRAVSFGFRRNPVYESFEVHCCPVSVFWSSLLFGKVLFVSAKLPPDSNRCLRTHLDTALYVN